MARRGLAVEARRDKAWRGGRGGARLGTARLDLAVEAKGAQGLWNLSRSVLRPARLIKVA